MAESQEREGGDTDSERDRQTEGVRDRGMEREVALLSVSSRRHPSKLRLHQQQQHASNITARFIAFDMSLIKWYLRPRNSLPFPRLAFPFPFVCGKPSPHLSGNSMRPSPPMQSPATAMRVSIGLCDSVRNERKISARSLSNDSFTDYRTCRFFTTRRHTYTAWRPKHDML